MNRVRFLSPYRITDVDSQEPIGIGVQLEATYGVIIQSCSFMDLKYGVQWITNNRNFIISGCFFNSCEKAGIHQKLGDAHQMCITSNQISYCKRNIYIEDPQGINDCQIVGNTIETGVGVPKDADYCVLFEHSGTNGNTWVSGIQVVGNTIQAHGHSVDPILAFLGQSNNTGGRWYQVEISGNKFTDTASTPIVIEEIDCFDVNGNTAKDFDSNRKFIEVHGGCNSWQISNNVVGEPQNRIGGLLQIDGGKDDVNTFSVSNNTIYGNANNNIIETDAVGSLICGNISGNVINIQSGTENDWAIELIEIDTMWSVSVKNNNIEAINNFKGIKINPTSIHLSQISGNTFNGASTKSDAYDLPAPVSDDVIVKDNLWGDK